MTWLRVGDTSWTNPKVQALADPADGRLLREAWGFLVLVATLSAQHQTDYLVDPATATMVGGDRTEVLLAACQRAGLVERTGRGRTRVWRIVEDPDVLHIRLRDAVAWEKQQRADTRSERYRVACYLRDGDACRWCGVVVQPNDHRSARGRTLDHLAPGQPAGSPDGLVVACRACNGARGQDWQDESARAGFAGRWPLRAAPAQPYWAPSTVTWLADRGHHVQPAHRPATGPTPQTPGRTCPPRPSQDRHASSRPDVAPDEPHQPSQGRAPAAAATPPPDEPHQPTQGRAPAPSGDDVDQRGTQPSPTTPNPEDEPHQPTQGRAPAATDSTNSSITPTSTTKPSPPNHDPRQTHGSGTASPGRVGTGRVESSTGPQPSPPLSAPEYRAYRGRGRRRPRSPGAPT